MRLGSRQFGRKSRNLRLAGGKFGAAIVNDVLQIEDGSLEFVVDHDIVELVPVAHVFGRVAQPPLDGTVGIGAAALEPHLERIAGTPEQYARWATNPTAVDPSFAELFGALNDEARAVLEDATGAVCSIA